MHFLAAAVTYPSSLPILALNALPDTMSQAKANTTLPFLEPISDRSHSANDAKDLEHGPQKKGFSVYSVVSDPC